MQFHALSERRATQRRPMRFESLLGLIGNTPLVRLRRVTAELPDAVEVWAKLEYLNPGGSVKDRAARQIMLDALHRGDLGEGKVLLDATSGNTGIAYAMLGATLGIEVLLVMPEDIIESRRHIVETYGARIIGSPAAEGDDGAIRLAREMAEGPDADRYWYADQYGNPSNALAHELTTAREIWEQSDGRATHFVTSIGSAGTIMGTGRGLKELAPATKVLACQPATAAHGVEGVRHIESSLRPALFDADLLDGMLSLDPEQGREMAQQIARAEGFAVGDSAGLNVLAALEVAAGLESGVVVTVMCDRADRYSGG